MLSLLLVIISLFTLNTAQVFTLKTFNPGAPLNGQKIHASGQAFYLGLDGPNTYCPSKVDPNCPSPTDTIVAGALSAMWVRIPLLPLSYSQNSKWLTQQDEPDADKLIQVEVPGGQQTFVRSEGSIGYTQAHSTSVPAGAHRGGFVNVIVDSDCSEDVNTFTWKAPDGSAGELIFLPHISSLALPLFFISLVLPTSASSFRHFAAGEINSGDANVYL